MKCWSESVVLALLLFQTMYISLLAADGQDVDSGRHDMVAQCSVGGQPKLDRFSTHTRL